MLRNTVIAGMLALAPALALAQQPAPTPGASPGSSATTAPTAPAPTPEHNFTGNVGLFSQYIFRGLTQTNRDPALQGGFDYGHSSGFYAGTWGSNISWLRENVTAAPGGVVTPFGTYGEGGSLELDFYGGYKTTFGDFGLDVGTLYYWYPGKIHPLFGTFAAPFNDVPKANTWEAYVGGSWKWFSAKLSYALTDKVFANRNAGGTLYLDLTATVPLGDFAKGLTGFTATAHWGYQKYRGTDPRNVGFAAAYGGRTPSNDDLFSYKDIKLGLAYALPKDFTIGAFYTKAYDANILGYGGALDVGPGGLPGPFPRNVAKGTGTVYVQKTF